MAGTLTTPIGFTDLWSAYHSATDNSLMNFGNVIGVVVDFMPPTINTRSGQHQCFFKLNDPSLINSLHGFQGLSIKFFQRDTTNLPHISGDGDIVLLRQIKMTNYRGQPVGLSNYQTQVAVFPADSIPEPAFDAEHAIKGRLTCRAKPGVPESLTRAEQRYVIDLKATMEPLLQRLRDRMTAVRRQPHATSNPSAPLRPSSAIPSKRPGSELGEGSDKYARTGTLGPKFKLVEELEHYMFADLCVQVAKKYITRFGPCELYVTDYTSNPQGWYFPPPEDHPDGERDGDEFGLHPSSRKAFPGPYGHYCFKINVKTPHCWYVNSDVEEGSFVLLQNVKCKIMRDGTKLEGDMWEDPTNPDRIKVKLITGEDDIPEIKALKERKEVYWRSRQARIGQREPQGATKRRRKNTRKRTKQYQARVERGMARNAAEELQATPNKHIRCSHTDVPLTSLADIIDKDNARHINTFNGVTCTLPFINAKYRTRGRVVDFHPNDLQDFAVPSYASSKERSEFPQRVTRDSCPTWEWSFSLLIEDGSSSRPLHTANASNADRDALWLHVSHQDAQRLLGNAVADPADLRQDKQLLARLREQLYILWGNLEEIKARQTQERLSNRPFECCVMEYGQPLDESDATDEMAREEDWGFGFVRLYRLFGTVIS